MPKEVTHWWLASEVLESLEAPLLAGLVRQNKNVFLLGAVGPDFLFYYLYGNELAAFREAAMVLHGADGSDTLAVLAKTAEKYFSPPEEGAPPRGEAGNPSAAVWAFLFGYACHVAADSVFHPLVLYCVGKGGAESLYNHYRFETALDLYVKNTLRPARLPLRITELTAAMEMPRQSFLELLGRVSFGGQSYNAEALRQCLRRYEHMQPALWKLPGKAASSLLGILRPRLRHFSASFYRKSFTRLSPLFAQVFRYANPVSGQNHEHSIGDLRSEVVRQALAAAAVFENALRNPSGNPAAELGKLRGPNLETGLYGDNAKKIVYTIPGGFDGLIRSAGL